MTNFRTATKTEKEDICLAVACDGIEASDLRDWEAHYSMGDSEYLESSLAVMGESLTSQGIDDIRDISAIRRYMEKVDL